MAAERNLISTSALGKRVRQAIRWRKAAWRDWIYHQLGRLGPRAFVNLRWPWPLKKPYQRKRLILKQTGSRLGDALMCTPVLREIKKRNPRCHITFITHYPELFAGNPHIDELVSHPTAAQSRVAIRLGYEHMTPLFKGTREQAAQHRSPPHNLHAGYKHATPPPRPLISLMGECVGLCFFDNQLDCALPEVPPPFASEVDRLPRPLVVIQTSASDWSPNKRWPTANWLRLVHLLSADCTVCEVGNSSVFAQGDLPKSLVSYAGKTSLAQYVYLVAHADVFVGFVSSGMHLANAFRIPSVILYGGHEAPDGHRYPLQTPLFVAVECARCWLETPCPYGVKCMSMITPEQVWRAARQRLRAQTQEMPTPSIR